MFTKLYFGACAVFVVLLVARFDHLQTNQNFQHFMMLFAVVLLVAFPIKRRVRHR